MGFDLVFYYIAWYVLLAFPIEVSFTMIISALLVRALIVFNLMTPSRFLFDFFVAGGFVILGFAVEIGFLSAGVLFQANGGNLPPVWLLALWWVLGWSFISLFGGFRKRPALLSLLSAVFAPLSYYWGCQLRVDYSLGGGVGALFAIATVWAVVLPLVLKVVFIWPVPVALQNGD